MRLQTNNYADRCGGALSPPELLVRNAKGGGFGGVGGEEKKETQEVASVTLRYPNRNKPPPAT